MRFFTLFALALAPFVSAQGTKIQFTQIPGPAVIGQASTIKWTGGTSDPVTLLLLEGELSSPRTIGILGTNLPGNSFSWTPGSALTPASDYLLEITQGTSGVGFSGQFSLQNSTAGQATTIYIVGGGSTIVSTITPNATSTVTMMAGSSAGTGTALPRNTTFVSPSLTSMANMSMTGTPSMSMTGVASTTTTATSSTSAGGALAKATAQAMLGFGAIAAAAVYLL